MYHRLKKQLLEKNGYERRQTSKIKKCCCSLCRELPDSAQSSVFCWQIVTEQTSGTFLSVNKTKKLGMLLNVVHLPVFNHSILMEKLEHFGIRGDVITGFHPICLTNEYQSTHAGSCISKKTKQFAVSLKVQSQVHYYFLLNNTDIQNELSYYLFAV